MAGAGKGNGKGPAVATGAIMGGFLCLGLVMAGVAATIVLSLISIYTSDNSKQSNGDYFKIPVFGMKSLHSVTTSSFNSGTVNDNTDLNTLCKSVFSSSSSATNFYGCKTTNFKATTANSSNSSRRRRQSESGLIMIGEIRIYYSTSCGTSGDKNKGSNSTSISSCVKTRLSQCNSLANSTNFKQWTPITTTITLSILNNASTWVSITPSRLYAASPSQTASYIGSISPNSTAQSQALLGCIYGGPLSLTAIAADLASTTTTTTASTSTAASG